MAESFLTAYAGEACIIYIIVYQYGYDRESYIRK